MSITKWLLDRPAVVDGRILIDIRGAFPIAIAAHNRMHAKEIRERDDFVNFVLVVL